MNVNAADLIRQLESAMGDLERAIDPAANEAERTERMQKYTALTPSLRKLAKADIEQAEGELRQEQQHRAGLALYAVGRPLVDHEEALNADIEQAKEAPTLLDAYVRTFKRSGGHSTDEWTGVSLLEEMKLANVDRDLHDALPSVLLAAYTRALQSPDPKDTVIVRYIEQRHLGGWAGPSSTDPKEATALQQLRRRINQTREARVPEEYRRAKETIQRARKAMQRAQDLFGIVPRNPEHQPVGG